MPRYDYKCVNCQTEFELRQSFAEAGNGVCPSCSGVGRRVFHAVPVIYKGSGFYTTDYGRPKRPSENGGKESKDSSDSESSTSDSAASSKEGSAKTDGASKEASASTSSKDSASKSSSEAPAST